MTRFRDLPIRRKLLLLTFRSTAAALILASGGFLAWDMERFRSNVYQDIRAQAVTLAENSGAPLTFRDDRIAGEILGVLPVRPRVQMACLYPRERAVFIGYQRDVDGVCPPRSPDRDVFGWQTLEVVVPVIVNQAEVGTLFIRRDLNDLYERLRVGGVTMLGVLLVALAAAFLTSARMQRSIAAPLLQLADTARAISTTRNYSLRATPVSNDEIGVVMRAFNEMLDRIADALERERVANRLKDEFLATLSHELRTPLNAVLGWTRLLRSGRLSQPERSKALETIERNARAQAMLIDDLLDMSRIVSGRPRFQPRDADLAAIVDAAVEVIQPAAAAKRLRLTVDIAVRPALTYGDPGRLQQVVWNLVSNAVKFTPSDGQVWVRLEQDHGYRLIVRDSGSGIDPSFLPFVFDPFRQADATASRPYGGLGLGLSIAKQLVELHGGTIEAHSPGRGKGATFEVRLPSVVHTFTEDAAPESIRALPPADPDRSLLRGLRVLVVDDEEDARVLLDTALRQYGAEVTTVGSVPDAFAEIERRHPDVLLSDLGMPNQDGHALIRQLRRRPPSQGGAIPAVAITAYASTKDALAAEAAGFQAHIAKPFEVSDVANLVALLAQATQRGGLGQLGNA